MAGRWELGVIDSRALAGNPLGDPARRPVWVYLPPGYDDAPDTRWPAAYLLRGFTGQLDMWGNRRAFTPTFPEQVDRLFADAGVPGMIVVLVDAWTRLGGAQYLDSPAVGRYATYLSEDVVGWVDAGYRTVGGPAGRAVVGHSSGGYGALVNGLLRPDVWGGVGSHAGDALFECCYLPDVPDAARILAAEYGGSWDAWWGDVGERGLGAKESDFTLVNLWAMGACYSPRPGGGVDLPFEPSGRLRLDVWERWLAWDPVRMIPVRAEAARQWRAVWIDGGTRDEAHLDVGARALRTALADAGVSEDRVGFEIHGGRHGNQEGRFLVSLAFFAGRLGAAEVPG